MNKVTILGLATVAILSSNFIAAPIFAADENNIGAGLTAVGAPLGLHGADPVAFIEIGNRIDGNAAFAAKHEGVAYYFSTEANKTLFVENPQRYVPQNGGFCTFGVAVGKKFDGNPQYASVVDGKLYLFLNEGVFRAYQEDQAGTIVKASKQWKSIKHKAAASL